jgi:hypothetical protein
MQVYGWHKHFCASVTDDLRWWQLQDGDAQGLVHYKFTPEECTVSKEIYIKIRHHLRDAVRRKPGMKQQFLLHNKAPAHWSLVVKKKYLAKHSMAVLEHLPYAPDFSLPDYFSHSVTKSDLKG